MVATGSPGRPGATRRRGSVRRVVGASVGALLTLTLLTGCSVDRIFALGWPLDHVTPESDRMFDLWIGSTIAALAVGVFTWALIFWCVIRYRKRGEELPAQTRYNLPIEIVFTVTPVLVVSMLFYFTAVIQNEVNRTGDAELTVSVQASKWNWTFAYPGTTVDGTDDPVSTVGDSDYIPVLVVPTGTRILFEEKSADVIHSFWVPKMLFKRDVIPGVTNVFETSITEEGAYVGRCAELCGTYHSMMNFEVRAVSPEQFAQWLEAKQGGASTPDALRAIGEDPYAVTTKPFPTRRQAATN